MPRVLHFSAIHSPSRSASDDAKVARKILELDSASGARARKGGSGKNTYSATREDDTTFIFSHFGLFLSDAASNSHK